MTHSYGLRDFCIDDPNGFVLRFAQVIDAQGSWRR